MKFLLAFSFVVITVMSVSHPANPECDDFGNQEQISASLGMSKCTLSEASSTETHQHDDHSGAFHNCHLGHCSFTFSSNVAVLSYTNNSIFSSLEKDFVLSDYKANLFRPPIS